MGTGNFSLPATTTFLITCTFAHGTYRQPGMRGLVGCNLATNFTHTLRNHGLNHGDGNGDDGGGRYHIT
uniref:Putative secreted protein n=1 Tax=Anopheles marajoara TaxID=58244 RepID=A0A2M4CG38_9DIPT